MKTSDEQRLVKAGWKPRKKHCWQSPYTSLVLTEEKAVRTELLLESRERKFTGEIYIGPI